MKLLLITLLILTLKLSASSGYENQFDETWISQFGAKAADSPRASALDSLGNLIIVGQTDGNLTGETTEQKYCSFIAKITSDGERSWTNQCKIGALEYFNLVDVTVDEHNNIYVLGTYDYDSDVMVIKLDADANLIWSKVFGRNDATEEPKAIYRASDGSLYITGVARSQSGSIFLTRLTADGQTATTKEFGSLEGWTTAVAVDGDSQGNIYVAGYAEGDFDGQTNSGNEDIFLTKFNTDGNKVWTKLFGSTSAPEYQLKSDLTRDMTIVNDIIYIAGDTQGNLGEQTNSGNYDMFVTKFSTEGVNLGTVLQGAANLDNPENGAVDHVGGMTVTSNGAIYLFGTTTGQFSGSVENGNGYAQLALVKFNSDGSYAWANQFLPNWKINMTDDGEAMALHKDSADNLYLLARVNYYYTDYYDTQFPDIAAFKLTEINSTRFSLFSENKFSSLDARGVVERSGDLIVAGAESSLDTYVKEFLFDVSLSGPHADDTAYGQYAPAPNHPIAIDSNNNTYVISFSDEDIAGQPANGYDSTVVTKYDHTGSVLWVKRFNSTSDNNIPYAITYHDNKLFIVGSTEGNIDGSNDNNGSDSKDGLRRVDGFVLALNANDGTKIWVDQFSEGNTNIVLMRDVGVDTNGYLHIVGGNDGSIVLNTYRTDGTLVALEQYGSGVNSLSNMGLAISGTNLYIVGTALGDFVADGAQGNGDIFLTKIDKSSPAQGHSVWKKQRGTATYEEGNDIAIGEDGNLYIVGFSSGDLDGPNAGETDFIIESYSTSGVLLAARQSGTAEDDKYYSIVVDSMGGLLVSGATGDPSSTQQAILQRYILHKSDLFENTPLLVCINETLGADSKHIPTLEELESINSFTCTDKNLLTVAGIEYMPNLVYLDLMHNSISDLTPLNNLVRLDYLNLAYNRIENITPLEELKTLSYLHLTGNEISDISTLVSFTGLQTLSFGDNHIEDISALQNMIQLRFLIMENNLISDIGVIQGLSSLETLYLGGNMIRDFSPIPAGVEVHGEDTQNIQSINIAPIISYLLN